MASTSRVYLDNAATSWPKPEAVYRAVDDCLRRLGAPAGRSAYTEAVETARMVAAARTAVARLIGADDARHVVFTLNGTDALNLAIHGTLRPGDHVVTTTAEHNSVLRPLRWWQTEGQIEVTRVECDGRGIVDPGELREAVRDNTRLVAVIHASNVTGAVQPIRAIGEIARQAGALLLVDAAQSLGHLPLHVAEAGIDLLAAPGHKGLLGPPGTGVLYLRPGVERHLQPIRQGGTGTASEDDRQPDELPHRYESGSLNTAGIVGLGAGVEYLLDRGMDDVRRHDRQLAARLIGGLRDLPGVTVHGLSDDESAAADDRVGVVSVSLEGYDPQEAAALLDAGFGVQIRAGLHCAPLMHRRLGTLSRGGTVRLSISPLTSQGDIDTALQAIGSLVGSVPKLS